jgi:hypothetical protein
MGSSQPPGPALVSAAADADPVIQLVLAWLSARRSQNTRAAYARDIGITPQRRPGCSATLRPMPRRVAGQADAIWESASSTVSRRHSPASGRDRSPTPGRALQLSTRLPCPRRPEHKGSGMTHSQTSAQPTEIVAVLGASGTMGFAMVRNIAPAQALQDRGIRVNVVAPPGPVWTPLIPTTFDPEPGRFIRQPGVHGPRRPAGRDRPVLRLLCQRPAVQLLLRRSPRPHRRRNSPRVSVVLQRAAGGLRQAGWVAGRGEATNT